LGKTESVFGILLEIAREVCTSQGKYHTLAVPELMFYNPGFVGHPTRCPRVLSRPSKK
jgi:hypothetical protein